MTVSKIESLLYKSHDVMAEFTQEGEIQETWAIATIPSMVLPQK